MFQDVLKWQYQAQAAEFAPGGRSDGTLLFQDLHFLKSEKNLFPSFEWNRQRSHVLHVHPAASSVASDRCEC